VIAYRGQFEYNGNAHVAVYGWTKNPLVEYYIVENFGTYNPINGTTPQGSITVDGAVYDVGKDVHIPLPTITGDQTFERFFSVRQNKRSSGRVDVGAHFRAWADAGMKIGTDHDYQIMVCESYLSLGACNITVSAA
jgi:endo-1,4-beta-xylanase